ncbi:MAG: HlyC/CorC family transporter [Pseudomonadales bacterium]|nr:HlyC/CorC family transporter [Pseudomonadales bacterium]
MDDTPLSVLAGILFLLICASGFFSSAETSMMSLNRYRLKHLAKNGHRGAKLAYELLQQPDRLIGVILIGNNFVNIVASAIATIIAIRLWGNAGIAIATGLLTLIILVFAEVAPKTLANAKPERIAFPAAFVLKPLLQFLYPIVWLINAASNRLLRMLGVNFNDDDTDQLSRDELRTVVNESGTMIPKRHRKMLISILDLEQVTVDDIMIPRNEVVGINIDEDIDDIIEDLRTSQHTRLPVYKGDLNNPIGMLHSRNALRFITDDDEKSKATLLQHATEPYFVPESTQLHTQMGNFQKNKKRQGLVVDEYGDVKGLVTLEDILEEIVGEFTTDLAASSQDIHPQEDGSFFIDGSATIREINRTLTWDLPTDGPKTMSGLIVEHLEFFPNAPLCFRKGNYVIEVKQMKDNMIKTARVFYFTTDNIQNTLENNI